MPATADQNRARARAGLGVRSEHPQCRTCTYYSPGGRRRDLCLAGFAHAEHSHSAYRLLGKTARPCPDTITEA